MIAQVVVNPTTIRPRLSLLLLGTNVTVNASICARHVVLSISSWTYQKTKTENHIRIMASCFDALKSSKHFAQNKKRKEKI
jgi:hypothetical protein